MLTSGVVNGSALLGASSFNAKTGVFTLTPSLAAWFASGSGSTLSQGVVLSSGVGVVLSEGVMQAER